MAETAATMFDTLVSRLKGLTGVEFAEYEWKTRPAGNYGTVQYDFEAEDDNGDDMKMDAAYEGSVHLFTHGKQTSVAAEVEGVLNDICESCWRLNSEQYEHETGLVHREYVFQLESR